MNKMLTGTAALALAAMLALPGAASAAERRADGLRGHDAAAITDVSARRYHHRRHVVIRRAWGPRFGYYRPYYRPYYAGYPYWGSPYYSYGYSPGFSIGFGFGPRWGWGW